MPTVYVTAPREVARDLAESLVEERYAACVNVLDCDSVYRWEGDVVTDEESVLLAKTTDDGYDALVEFVAEEHPYDVPCIERFDTEDVEAAFGEWIQADVSPTGT
jgi:periplasmic divalent cation tolerance protein